MGDIFDEVAKDAPKTAPAAQAKPDGDIFDQVAKANATASKQTPVTPAKSDQHKAATGLGDVVGGAAKSLYQVSTPGIMGTFLKQKFPNVAAALPSALTEYAAEPKELPNKIMTTGLLSMAPEGEAGEGGAVGESARGKAIPVEGSTAVGRVGKVLARRIPGVKLTEDIIDAIKGSAPAPPPSPVPKVPETNGIPWGTGKGPISLRGKVIPIEPTFPGAPLPEHPGVFPGAHLPEHPGVFPGAPLPETPSTSILQAASLNRIPAARAIPAAESGEALGAIPSAKPTQAIPVNVKPQRLQELIQEGTGGQPLKPNVPLRDQAIKINSAEAPAPVAHRNPMEAAHGKAMYEAAKGEPETMRAIHELTRVDVRQALINSGEDMGQKIVTNSKFAGGEGITREEAFNLLLKKGYSPKQIVKLAKKPIEVAKGVAAD